MGQDKEAISAKLEAEKTTVIEHVAEIANLTQDIGLDSAYMMESKFIGN